MRAPSAGLELQNHFKYLRYPKVVVVFRPRLRVHHPGGLVEEGNMKERRDAIVSRKLQL